MTDLLAFGPRGWSDELLAGMALSLALAAAALPLGLSLGGAAALAKASRSRILRAAGEGFTTIFRGVPELLTLLLIYYGGQFAVQWALDAAGIEARIEVAPFAAGVLALSLVFAAYASEVILGALRAVDRGQAEAAESFGMPPRVVFRRITLPQLVRLALPGLGNCWLVLLKDTSLVSVIALQDLLRATQLAVAATREPFLFYALACMAYLVLTALSDVGLRRAEAWSARGLRAPG